MSPRTGVAIALGVALVGCAPRLVGKTPDGAAIVEIPLSISNAYLVKTKTPVLIDAGSSGDLETLRAKLAESGVPLESIALVILTHGHADHAALASDIRAASHAKIMLGEGDVPLARAGHDDELHPTSITGRLQKPFIPKSYTPFEPDIVVKREPIDLHAWGIDGHAIEMPGHTEGSLVVVMSNHAAFVGDMMLGGAWGGLLWSSVPGQHYFQRDEDEDVRNIATLLSLHVETFYLGHGGPVAGGDVAWEFGLN